MVREVAAMLCLASAFAPLLPSLANTSECPVINGRFYKDYTKSGEEWRRINAVYTKVENGKYSYRFIDNHPFYIPVDGKWHPVTAGNASGFAKVTCADKRIKFETTYTKTQFYSYKIYRYLDYDRISIESSIGSLNGIFEREKD